MPQGWPGSLPVRDIRGREDEPGDGRDQAWALPAAQAGALPGSSRTRMARPGRNSATQTPPPESRQPVGIRRAGGRSGPRGPGRSGGRHRRRVRREGRRRRAGRVVPPGAHRRTGLVRRGLVRPLLGGRPGRGEVAGLPRAQAGLGLDGRDGCPQPLRERRITGSPPRAGGDAHVAFGTGGHPAPRGRADPRNRATKAVENTGFVPQFPMRSAQPDPQSAAFAGECTPSANLSRPSVEAPDWAPRHRKLVPRWLNQQTKPITPGAGAAPPAP